MVTLTINNNKPQPRGARTKTTGGPRQSGHQAISQTIRPSGHPQAISASGQQTRPSDRQTVRPSDRQTIRPSDHQTVRPSGHPQAISASGHQCVRPSDQTIRPSDRQTIRPSDHQTIRPSDRKTTRSVIRPSDHQTISASDPRIEKGKHRHRLPPKFRVARRGAAVRQRRGTRARARGTMLRGRMP